MFNASEHSLKLRIKYRIVGFFEVHKFRKFRGLDQFVKLKSSENIYQNVRILNYIAACMPSMRLAHVSHTERPFVKIKLLKIRHLWNLSTSKKPTIRYIIITGSATC